MLGEGSALACQVYRGEYGAAQGILTGVLCTFRRLRLRVQSG